MYKFLGFIFTIAVFSYANSFAQSDRFDIKPIIKALNEKDDVYLLSVKADAASIGDLPYPADQSLLKAILKNYAPIVSYTIKGIDSGQNQYRVNLEVVYQTGRTGKPGFVFNKDGKWVNLDIIRRKKEVDIAALQQQSFSNANFPDTLYTHFVLDNGLIYIPVQMGDSTGYLMLDSGAPLVILNKACLPADKIEATSYDAMQGIGGSMGNNGTAKTPLKIGNLMIDPLTAPVADMAKYSDQQHLKVFGLLGYELFKNYALILNYQTQELLLIKRQKGQQPPSVLAMGKHTYTLSEQVPFTLQRHIAIVSLTFDGKQLPFGLDCGANGNLFKTSLYPQLQSHFETEGDEINVAGMGDAKGKGRVGYIMHATIGKEKLDDMYTVFSDQKIGMGNGNDALQIEGLLGTPFLNLHVTEIDYINQRVILYKY